MVAQLLGRRSEGHAPYALNDREGEILELMAEGRSNQAICERLFLSASTVQAHVGSRLATHANATTHGSAAQRFDVLEVPTGPLRTGSP